MGGNKDGSAPTDRYINHIIPTVQANEDFLRKSAKETCDEVIELVNDAIDYVGFAVRKTNSVKNYVECSMPVFLQNILMPFSYAIYLDLIACNIPVCFMELRLVLESLGKCYLADITYPQVDFSQRRLELLEDYLEKKSLSTSKVLKELGRQLGLKEEFVALWGQLSEGWVHTKGIVSRVTNQIVEKGDVPAWAWAIPMNYAESDLDSIDELHQRISQFRHLLKAVMDRYWGLPSSSAAG